MRKTLLEYVQDIIRHSGGNPPDSIDQNPEAGDVASIIRGTFYYLLAEYDWPHRHDFRQLTTLADTARPTYMELDQGLFSGIQFIKYDTADTGDDPNHKKLIFKYQEDFVNMLQLNSRAPNVDEVETEGGVKLYVRNDIWPTYWTYLDNKYVVCDAYKSDEESYLDGGRTTVFCLTLPEWQNENSFVPPVPVEHVPMFEAECARAVAIQLRSEPSVVDEQRARYLRARNKHVSGKPGEEVRPRKRSFGRRRRPRI